MKRGFSTLEIMIAFALLSLILTGVVLSQFSANYWQIASQTSNEALYIAKTHLEIERGAAQGEFTLASSTATAKNFDAACLAGGLCYYVTNIVTELSACSKYVKSRVDWSVQNYPTTTTSLFTTVTSPTEAVLLGGDCPLVSPAGNWTNTPSVLRSTALNGNPTGMDSLEGYAYITQDAAPYFAVASSTGPLYQNPFGEVVALNGLDVARDEATGRTYAYVARNDAAKQLGIIDLTDMQNPATTTRPFALGMSGDVTSPSAFGWRVYLYDRKAYVVTKQTGQPDLHVVDVSSSVLPVEKGDYTLNTTANDLVVRDRKVQGVKHRYVYLATTDKNKEVIILDATDPTAITTVSQVDIPESGCGLSDPPDATTISLVGTMLYVGREYSSTCSSLATVYAIDVTSPSSPVLKSSQSLNTGKTVVGLKISGGLAFLEETSQVAAASSAVLDVDTSNIFAGRPISSGQQFVEVWSLASASMLSRYTIGNALTVLKNTP